jgi:BolA protein|tara:strand:+ start:312 stop:629 length:318 start_codon:yes stop_codon:yes gene_type:complete
VDTTANKLLELVLTPLNISHHQLDNDSHKHSGSATDSHYNLVLVSDDFAALGPVKRHQKVYALVGELMQNPIHALALHCYTSEQWQAKQEKMPATAPCMGGSKTA